MYVVSGVTMNSMAPQAIVISGMPPGMQRTAWSKKLPCPPLAWSARLSSKIF
jgi:hypothetical protein